MIKQVNSYSYNPTNPNITFGARKFVPKTAKKLQNKILNPKIKNITISAHASPDQDCRCASEVMANYATKNGKAVDTFINETKCHGLFVAKSAYPNRQNPNPSDLLIALDYNTKSKMPKSFKDAITRFKRKNIIGFDHHMRIAGDKLKGNFYMDKTAKSCCGILFRFFEAIGEKLPKNDLEILYCGMLSDLQKSKLVKIEKGSLTRLPALSKDKNTVGILNKMEFELTREQKQKVYRHLDVLSSLSPEEKAFRKRIFNSFNTTPDGKLAYIVIEPKDQEWAQIGDDNTRTSEILGDFRRKLINGVENDSRLTPEQKESLKGVQGAIVFYPSGGAYQMSVHTKPGEMSALELIANAKKEWKKLKLKDIKITGGGHENRAGSRMLSIEKQDAQMFINTHLKAAEITKAPKKVSFFGALKNLFKPKKTNKG